MSAHRTLAVLAGSVVLTALAAGPAAAHGGPTNPVSRQAACGTEAGESRRSAACQAAIEIGGAKASTDWDNLRLPDVAGRDRARIRDGQLCSAGIGQFRGLDLARSDWPTTSITSGSYTFSYRGTIPHKGTFRLYVTKDGFQPTQPLTWSDLESAPFLTATDPVLRNGSYRIPGRVPAGKSGRHIIYTIWQNSDTPDTYYSCSDVVFGSSASRGSGDQAAQPPAGAQPGQQGQPGSPTASASTAPDPAAAAQPEVRTRSVSSNSSVSSAVPVAIGAGIVLVVVGLLTLLLRRRRA